MRRAEFPWEAEAEFISASQYHEEHAENLGFDFVTAVQRSYQRLLDFPDSGRPFGGRLRRVLLPGFPYELIYRAEADPHPGGGPSSSPPGVLAFESLTAGPSLRRERALPLLPSHA